MKVEVSLGDYSAVLNLWTLSTIVMFKMSQFFIEFNNEILRFSSHLKSIHELEMFYGDEILGSLIKHSYHLVDTFENYGEVLGFDNDNGNQEVKTDYEEDKDFIDEEKDKENRQTIPFQPQLFYGGTRKGDS